MNWNWKSGKCAKSQFSIEKAINFSCPDSVFLWIYLSFSENLNNVSVTFFKNTVLDSKKPVLVPEIHFPKNPVFFHIKPDPVPKYFIP